MIKPPFGEAGGAPVQPPHPTDASALPKSGSGFDITKLKQWAHIVIKRIWIVAICFTISLVVSVVNLSKQEAIYRADCSLLLSRGTRLVGETRSIDQETFGDFIDTQIRIMQSRAIRDRAQQSMNLTDGEVNSALRRLSVYTIGRASVIKIVVDSLDPQFSADYANAIAQAYIEFKADERTSGSQTTIVNLTQQANRIREELRKGEESLMAFKREHSDILIQREGNVAARMMSDVAARASQYRLERMILEMQKPMMSDASDDVVLAALSSSYRPIAGAESMRAGVTGGDEGDPLQSGVTSASGPLGAIEVDNQSNDAWYKLQKRRAVLEHDLRNAREDLRDKHPMIKTLLDELEDVNAAIDREVEFATRKYYSELEALALKEQSLSRVASMWMDEALSSEMILDRYATRLNDVNRLKVLLDAVFTRIRQTDITSDMIPDTVTVIEKAKVNTGPMNPRKVQSIFLAGLIGIAAGIGIVIGLEFLDDSIRYPEDIEKSLGINFLGVIPAANWSESDIRTHLLSQIDPKSGLAESYRNIRATLLMGEKTRSFKTLLMTSSVPKEGKTTTSLNLAISFAQAGMRVLLVDADMRRGELHKYFGLEGGRGLSDVLSGQTKMESVIQRSGVPNLDFVATGPFPINPAELVLRGEFRFFVEHAKRTYDKIIFDGPPVMAVSEAAVLASLVDTTALVVWAGKTSRKLCQLTLQSLAQRGARIEGCILNNLEFGRVGYYYYSTYYSYYTYDYRYDETHRGTKAG